MDITTKFSRKFNYFRFIFFIPNKKRNRISINGLREHIFKEIFKLNCNKRNFDFFIILTQAAPLIINLLSPARRRASLFYVELASPGYLGFGFYLILNLLSPARRRGFLFYVELASPGYLGFRGYLSITRYLQPVCVPSSLTWNSHRPSI